MLRWRPLCCGALLVAAACSPNEPSASLTDDEIKAFRDHAAKVEEALGVFHDITVFERPSGSGSWQLVSGRYVPVTVGGTAPPDTVKDMQSDRPMMLPTHVQHYEGGDGQSVPYSVVGRMPGSNPEVQWVFVVRQYSIKKPTDDNFPYSGDIAVIGHHPRTGATAFYQFYKPAEPKSGRVVVAPFSEDGPEFWSPVDTIAKSFQCQRCHDTGPFIHTPWIDQVRVRETGPGEPPTEPMVPSDPLGPYFFIDADEGELFHFWSDSIKYLDKPANKCTRCHRAGPDLIGLTQNATRYAGVDPEHRDPFSVASDSSQTPAYRDLPWMPPVSMVDFYAGQQTVAPIWKRTYFASAAEVNGLTLTDTMLADIPSPPSEYRSIVVDRPHRDQIAPSQTVWLVDTRMRANTDGDLHQWRFYAKGPANADVLAAPVVYRRKPNDGSTIEFEVVFVGEPRSYESSEEWVAVSAGETFPTRQGDYFGIVFTNAGSEAGSAFIPYSDDDWAVLRNPDGTTRYDNGFGAWQGYVTLRAVSEEEAPGVGKLLSFGDPAYRTYSFELRNRL